MITYASTVKPCDVQWNLKNKKWFYVSRFFFYCRCFKKGKYSNVELSADKMKNVIWLVLKNLYEGVGHIEHAFAFSGIPEEHAVFVRQYFSPHEAQMPNRKRFRL